MRTKLLFQLAALIMCFAPIGTMAQSKEVEKPKVTIIGNDLSGDLFLYVINDKLYLGDATGSLLERIDKSTISMISVINDETEKKKYLEEVGKYASKVRSVFVIETTKEFVYKAEDLGE